MNKRVVAVYEKERWIFYNERGEEVKLQKIEDKKIYIILPDDFFYFFQTDILPKRRVKQTINAYAKTLFPLEDAYIGYLKGTNPVIGYAFLGDIKKIKDLLDKAEVVTTGFVINYVLHPGAFIYIGPTVTAISNGHILGYFKGDYKTAKKRVANLQDYEVIDVAEDPKQCVTSFFKLLQQKKEKAVHLPVAEIGTESNIRKNILFLIGLGLFISLFFAGNYFRYKSYLSELQAIDSKLETIYKKAFGGKKYQDPYGMLLYKATQVEKHTGIKPLELIFALSKAKQDQVKIDYLSYDKQSFKIKGVIKDYDNLLRYLSALNNLLGVEAKIEKTKNKNGTLEFSIVYTSK